MTRIIHLLFALCICTAAQGQHYLISSLNAGQNPGNINQEDEQPSAYLTTNYSGYTQVLGASASSWSSAQSIPFTFTFNSSNYSSYRVAPTGVVTFSSSVGAVPSSTGASLPNSNIPNNSICAWGLHLGGSNDAVMSKTFGTYPNRQHWIIWASASSNSLNGSSNWTYWAIVLEETTNKVHVVDMRTYDSSSGNVNLSVGLQYTTSSAISVSGSPNVASTTTATGGNGSTSSDNSYYTFIPGSQSAVDLELEYIDVDEYVHSSNPGTVTGSVKNLGSNTVTSYSIQWSDGTNNYSQTFSANLATGQTQTFSHSNTVVISPGSTATITVTASISNDADLSNNVLSTTCSGAAFIPHKVVVTEEATGTWCGWCPRGFVYMDYMQQNYSNDWVGIAVHNSDPMENSTYDNWMGTQISGYPSGLIDRQSGAVDPVNFESEHLVRVQEFGVADIDVYPYLDLNGLVSMTIYAHFAVPSTANYRLAGVVVENGVTGSSSDYNQVNYYSYQSQNIALTGAGINWQTATNPVPASMMVYDHVGRELLGGIDGAVGSVPSSVNAGDSVVYTYNFNLGSYDFQDLHLVALMLDNNTGEIVNAGHTDIINYETLINGDTLYVYGDDSVLLSGGVYYDIIDGDTTVASGGGSGGTGGTGGVDTTIVVGGDTLYVIGNDTIFVNGTDSVILTGSDSLHLVDGDTFLIQGQDSLWLTGGDTLVYYDGSWTSTSQLQIWDGNWVPLTVALAEIPEIELFPNPAFSYVFINGPTPDSEVSIYDSRGTLVRRFQYSKDPIQIHDLESGVYNVLINTDTYSVAKRLSVVR